MARKKAGEARDAAEADEDRSAILTDERSEDASTAVTEHDDDASVDEHDDGETDAEETDSEETDDEVQGTDTVEESDEVDDTDDELDDDELDDDDDDDDAKAGVGRGAFFATLGIAVVAVIGVLFLLGAYVWPAFLGPGSPDDTGNRAVSALGAKDSGALGQISCVRLDGSPAASFPPELLALVGKATPAGPSKQTLDTEARVPVDLTLTQGGQSQTLPADLLLGVNHGDWCLNGLSQRQ